MSRQMVTSFLNLLLRHRLKFASEKGVEAFASCHPRMMRPAHLCESFQAKATPDNPSLITTNKKMS